MDTKNTRLLTANNGFYCEAGGFHIDPMMPVARAVITHGHSDHARFGSESYLCAEPCAPILRARLGAEINVQTLPYGERLPVGDVVVSFHPSGHVLGSAQVRVEHRGEVWVASGDYKVAPDVTCAPFEPVRCHTFISESTFALPVYRWQEPEHIFAAINDWWRGNQERGKTSVLYAYALGKSQRILGGIDSSIGPIQCHGAVEKMNEVYRAAGVALPETQAKTPSLVVAPPSAQDPRWIKKYGAVSTGLASGWMRVRGKRRFQSVDRGFVLSDHADWPGLLWAIGQTGAEKVVVNHGYEGPLLRWLGQEQGPEA